MKKLGSLLGDREDMHRKKQLSYAAMNKLSVILKSQKVRIGKKIKAYKSIVKPVLCYNMSTWGLTKSEKEELDRTHRKQLRQLWNDQRMKNRDVYKKCSEEPISVSMKKMRWKAFGHMLRLPTDTPCQQSMNYYFEINKNQKCFSGKPRITLPTTINQDIKEAVSETNNINFINHVESFESREDLENLRKVANDRKVWKTVINKLSMIGVVQGNE